MAVGTLVQERYSNLPIDISPLASTLSVNFQAWDGMVRVCSRRFGDDEDDRAAARPAEAGFEQDGDEAVLLVAENDTGRRGDGFSFLEKLLR
eukprot:4378562-Amphidinium_carterae.1